MIEGPPLPGEIIDAVRRLHEEPERAYHGWSHVLDLLALWEAIRGRLHDTQAVQCAIVFHDAVYDPAAHDNEARSARLAETMLAGRLHEPTIGRVLRMIEATSSHAVPEGLPPDDAWDMAHFLDMDLSILGAPKERFDGYEEGIRHEYRHLPEEAFRTGRAAVLHRFLERDPIYLTEWGRDSFETSARSNLERSIYRLEIAS